MTTLRAWIIASWIAFPGVMAGGTLLLRRVALGDPSEFQVTWLRAFHAHGGVVRALAALFPVSRSDRSFDARKAAPLSCVVCRHGWDRGRVPAAGSRWATGGFLERRVVGRLLEPDEGLLRCRQLLVVACSHVGVYMPIVPAQHEDDGDLEPRHTLPQVQREEL